MFNISELSAEEIKRTLDLFEGGREGIQKRAADILREAAKASDFFKGRNEIRNEVDEICNNPERIGSSDLELIFWAARMCLEKIFILKEGLDLEEDFGHLADPDLFTSRKGNLRLLAISKGIVALGVLVDDELKAEAGKN